MSRPLSAATRRSSLLLATAVALAGAPACANVSGQTGSELACVPGPAGDDACAAALGEAHVCGAGGICIPEASEDPDAGVDPALLGHWTMPGATGTGVRAELTLEADGSIVFRRYERTDGPVELSLTGQYAITGTLLEATGVTDAGEMTTLSASFHVLGDALWLNAMQPQGAVSGVIGDWRSVFAVRVLDDAGAVIDDVGGGERLRLAADGSGSDTVTDVFGSDVFHFVGTWQTSPGEMDYMFVGEDSTTGFSAQLELDLTGDGVLVGRWHYLRVE